MALKDLLVHIDDGEVGAERMAAAVALAKRAGARVVGVAFALEAGMSSYVGIDLPSGLSDAERDVMERAAQSARGKLEAIAAAEGVPCAAEVVRCAAMAAPDRLAFLARHVDMSFLGQPRGDQPAGTLEEALLERVLLDSGRPVYVMPYIGRQPQQRRKAVIAWDGGPKAARAVKDALPVLQGRGGDTVVLVVNPGERDGRHGGDPGADVAAYLGRHDVPATVSVQVSRDLNPDTILLNFLAENGADLLVMGAYGHSRWREKAFGGVTETLLHQMTTPVLMSA